MKDKDKVPFTMSLNKELAYKMNYIASYYDRSRSREILRAIKEYVVRFEREEAPIPPEDEAVSSPLLSKPPVLPF